MTNAKKTILVIDDEAPFRDFMVELLKHYDFNVCIAENGISGEKQISTCQPDLIITDIVMPDKEGIEFIQSVRDINQQIPIIAVTGGNRVNAYSYLSMTKKMGANATLAKPFTASEIMQTINSLLASE